MQILLNGEPHDLAPGTTLAQLLDQTGLAGRRVAIERNLEIVPKARHADTVLADGDRVELVHALGGG